MATKQNGITRADAIAFAMERCTDNADVVEVLAKMHAQLTKPRAKAVSKARKANENLAAKVRDAIAAKGDGMSTKDIVALGLARCPPNLGMRARLFFALLVCTRFNRAQIRSGISRQS